MRMEGQSYTNPLQAAANKYLYNGKELQDDLGLDWYDYGFRMYDPVLARWHVIDPMIESHYDYTPYAYVYNNPMNLIDPFGLDTINVIINQDDPNVVEPGEIDEVVVKPNNDDDNNDDDSGLGWKKYDKDLNWGFMYWVSNVFNAAGTYTTMTELSKVKPNGWWKGKNGKWYPPKHQPNGSTGSKKTLLKKIGKFKIAGRLIFVGGVLISVGEFTQDPTFDQGVSSATDIGFGAAGTFGGPWGLGASVLYFGDKLARDNIKPYGRVRDDMDKAHGVARNLERRAMTNSQNMIHPCFLAGTKISTITGLKNIESIEIGDSVYSFNFNLSKVELKKVVKVFVRNIDEIYKLTINNKEIFTTSEHPFYLNNSEIVKVKNLKKGDLLWSLDKEELRIQKIEKLLKNKKVYNIRVDGNHNYFVGEFKALVHNK